MGNNFEKRKKGLKAFYDFDNDDTDIITEETVANYVADIENIIPCFICSAYDICKNSSVHCEEAILKYLNSEDNSAEKSD